MWHGWIYILHKYLAIKVHILSHSIFKAGFAPKEKIKKLNRGRKDEMKETAALIV
jgi:hypothetical protein